jgi:hypothetical protein
LSAKIYGKTETKGNDGSFEPGVSSASSGKDVFIEVLREYTLSVLEFPFQFNGDNIWLKNPRMKN